jgi:hypothetical protein
MGYLDPAQAMKRRQDFGQSPKQDSEQAVSDLNARQACVDSATTSVHRLEHVQSFE